MEIHIASEMVLIKISFLSRLSINKPDLSFDFFREEISLQHISFFLEDTGKLNLTLTLCETFY